VRRPSPDPEPQCGRSGAGEVGGLATVVGTDSAATRLAGAVGAMPQRRAGWVGCWIVRAVATVDSVEGEPGGWAAALPGGCGGLARLAPGSPSRPHPAAAGAGLVLGQAVAVGLVGRIHNAAPLRQVVAERGALLRGDDDAELLLHLMAQSSQRTVVNRLVDALGNLRGGFSFTLVTAGMCLAGRDPRGFRPLWIGTGEGLSAAASDPGALDAMGVQPLREVGAGELAILEPGSPTWTLRPWGTQHPAACVQEWVGLAPVGSTFEGLGVHALRQRLGLALAATCPVTADLVACLPGACPVAAMAFAAHLGLPMGVVFVPDDALAARWVALPGAVRGRRVALVHEPGVPAARMRAAVASLRSAGARQVHLRCVAPWLTAECRYGVRLPAPWPSAVGAVPGDTIAGYFDAESAAALSHAELAAALGRDGSHHCAACGGGAEPLPQDEASATYQLPLFASVSNGPNGRQAGMLDSPHTPGSRNQHG